MANGICGLRKHINQPQPQPQNQCNSATGTCGTATVQTNHVRQQCRPSSPQPIPGTPQAAPATPHGTTSYPQTQSPSNQTKLHANPLDTSKSKEISNGTRAQVNTNGVTVTIPLSNNDVGTGAKLEYSAKTPTVNSPRQPVGSMDNFVNSLGSEVVLHKVYSKERNQWELQATLLDSKTTAKVWVGGREYDLDPSKIKAELVAGASKEKATGAGTPASAETKKTKETEIKADKLSEMKALLEAAIKKAGEPTATPEEKAAKNGLVELRTALKTIEQKLNEAQKKLEAELKKPDVSEERKKEITTRLENIGKARSEGIVDALGDLAAGGTADPATFKGLVEKFKALWTDPTAKAPEEKKEKTEKKKAESTVDIERKDIKALNEAIAPAAEQLKLLQDSGLSDRTVENLSNILKEVELVKQNLLDERTKLEGRFNSSGDAAAKARIEQIDKLLDQDIPTYLKDQLYKKGSGLAPHTHLENLAEILHKNISIREKFKDALNTPEIKPSGTEHTISAGESKEMQLERGQILSIKNSKGEVVAEIQRDAHTKLDVNVANGTAGEQFAGLEITPERKVVIKGLNNPGEKQEYTVELKDLINGKVLSNEKLSIAPKSGLVGPEVGRHTLDTATLAEVDALEASIRQRYSKLEGEIIGPDAANPKVLEELAGEAGFKRDGEILRKPSADGKHELIVNKDLQVSVVVRTVVTPPPTPGTAPAVTPSEAVAKEIGSYQAAVDSLTDPAQREKFLNGLGFTKRGADYSKVSESDANVNLVVKDLSGKLTVGVEAIAPSAPVAPAVATEEAKKQREDLTKTLAAVEIPAVRKALLEAQGFTVEGDTMVKPSADKNYSLVVDKDFNVSLVPAAAPAVPTPPAPSADTSPSKPAVPSEANMQELAMQLIKDLAVEEIVTPGMLGGVFGNSTTYRLPEDTALRVYKTLENARVGGYIDELSNEVLARLKSKAPLPADISTFDDLLRDTYLKIYNDPVGKEQADFLRRSRFGHQAVELAEKIHGTNSMLITYATANNVLPEVRKFVEGDPKRWKDLEQAYAFVSYDKTPLRDVLDTFDYDGWDGYVRGQDMNVVDAALRKGLEAPTMKK